MKQTAVRNLSAALTTDALQRELRSGAQGAFMRTRKVITRSGDCVRGCFFSLKCGGLIQWQSLIERDGLLVMEFDERIAFLRGHQTEIRVDESFSAYPDVFTQHVDGTLEIVEVKDDAALADPKICQRLTRIAAHYERDGIRYRVMAEREIRQQPRLRNLESLETFLRPRAREHLVRDPQIRELLKIQHSTTLGYVASALGNPARALQLIANKFLFADLTSPLRPDTRISVIQGAQS